MAAWGANNSGSHLLPDRITPKYHPTHSAGHPQPHHPIARGPRVPAGCQKKGSATSGAHVPVVLGSARRYLSTVTLPLLTGRKRTGSDTLMGLNWNLQPKQSAESLKKETETMGLSKIWMGSTWETMQPPGW